MKFNDLKEKFFIMIGPNVIESEDQVLMMANKLKEIFAKYDVNFIFKTSFDKANRTSNSSYRGLGFEEGLKILKKVKNELNIPIITDIHESWQAEEVGKIVDIIQIPAFLCRQTDLLNAAAKTGKIIQIKKGQFCSADVMHKSKEKILEKNNNQVILCERGNSFGYQDLIVDPRNLIWLKSDTNLVSMDITHCLQQPAQKSSDGTIKAGGFRDLIPFMGKMAKSLDVNGIFMEVHHDPDNSLCDAPTQWPLDKLETLLKFLEIPSSLNSDMKKKLKEAQRKEKMIAKMKKTKESKEKKEDKNLKTSEKKTKEDKNLKLKNTQNKKDKDFKTKKSDKKNNQEKLIKEVVNLIENEDQIENKDENGDEDQYQLESNEDQDQVESNNEEDIIQSTM